MAAKAPRAETGAAPDEALDWPRRAVHLFILSGFAVAQPLFDLLGHHPEFFVAHDSRPTDLAALVAALCLLVPCLLFLAELIPGLVHRRAGRSIHSMLVATLATGGILPFLRGIELGPGWLWLLAALLLGLAAAAAYDRSARVRTYLTWFWPAPLMFAAAFTFLTPVRHLVLPASEAAQMEVEIDAETPVVLVVFDELPLPTLMDSSQRINGQRYPNFAAFSQRSHWLRNATATAELTVVAVPALLTGRRVGEGPGNVRLATAKKHPRNLFTLLAASYRLNVFESLTQLCPRQLCASSVPEANVAARLAPWLADLTVLYAYSMLPADLTRDLPNVTATWRDFDWRDSAARDLAGRTPEATARGRDPQGVFGDFLDTLRSGERRALYFLHSFLPHKPWRFLPSGKTYGTPGTGFLVDNGLIEGRWNDHELNALQAFQRYLLQLQMVDRLLGSLIDTLEETGLYDPALIIVTADHGASFHAGQHHRRLKPGKPQDILPVPLFIKLPHQRQGSVSDRNVELIDVMPTIARVLGAGEAPWPMDGDPIFDSGVPERPEKQVVLTPYESGRIGSFDPSELVSKSAAVARMTELFGTGRDPLDLYRFGPHPELIGSALSELEVAAEERREVRLNNPWVYDNVDLGSDFLPARVVGEIRSPEIEGVDLDLAVAIGGTVRAVTGTFDAGDGRASFAALVPESAFSPGRNRPEIFVVEGSASGPRLIPTRIVD